MKKPIKQSPKSRKTNLDAHDLANVNGGYELHGKYANDVLLNAYWDAENLTPASAP